MSFSNDQIGMLQAMGIDVWRSNDTVEKEFSPEVSDCVYRIVRTRCDKSDTTWLWFLGDSEPTMPELKLLTKIIQAVKLHIIERQCLSLDQLQDAQPHVMIALGSSAIESLTQDTQEMCIGWQGQHDLAQRLLVTHTLSDMLEQPSCKKIVWRDLQALQADTLAG